MAGHQVAAGLLGVMMLMAAGPGLGATPKTPPQKVTGPEISMLIRSTVVALHQANLTGNYSVLRDLGDSTFQASYSQAALSDMFRGFRDRRVNLEPAILYDSSLDAPPKLTTDGLLRVVGHFATAPEQVVFDITFHSEGGIWRLNSLNAGTRPVPLAAAKPLSEQSGEPVLQPVATRAPVPLAAPTARPAAPARRAAPQIGIVDVGDAATDFE